MTSDLKAAAAQGAHKEGAEVEQGRPGAPDLGEDRAGEAQGAGSKRHGSALDPSRMRVATKRKPSFEVLDPGGDRAGEAWGAGFGWRGSVLDPSRTRLAMKRKPYFEASDLGGDGAGEAWGVRSGQGGTASGRARQIWAKKKRRSGGGGSGRGGLEAG